MTTVETAFRLLVTILREEEISEAMASRIRALLDKAVEEGRLEYCRHCKVNIANHASEYCEECL